MMKSPSLMAKSEIESIFLPSALLNKDLSTTSLSPNAASNLQKDRSSSPESRNKDLLIKAKTMRKPRPSNEEVEDLMSKNFTRMKTDYMANSKEEQSSDYIYASKEEDS